MHISHYPSWGILKAGGAFELHHGREVFHEIVAFAKDASKSTNLHALSPADFNTLVKQQGNLEIRCDFMSLFSIASDQYLRKVFQTENRLNMTSKNKIISVTYFANVKNTRIIYSESIRFRLSIVFKFSQV